MSLRIILIAQKGHLYTLLLYWTWPEATKYKRAAEGLRCCLTAGLKLSRESGKGTGAVAEAEASGWWHGA